MAPYDAKRRWIAYTDIGLRGMRDALVPKLPASQRAELEERLRGAIDAENYELAAILRDELRMMEK